MSDRRADLILGRRGGGIERPIAILYILFDRLRVLVHAHVVGEQRQLRVQAAIAFVRVAIAGQAIRRGIRGHSRTSADLVRILGHADLAAEPRPQALGNELEEGGAELEV